MVAQLGERPSRVERINNAGDSRVERFTNRAGDTVYGSYDRHSYLKEKGLDQLGNAKSSINNAKNVAKNVFKKPVTLNFICMLAVSIILDLFSLIPGISIFISILYNVIFIPWFFFSGVKFNMKKIGSMGATSILEYIPFISFLPFMTLNVVYSYYSN